jgi:putative heme iron utilization protein
MHEKPCWEKAMSSKTPGAMPAITKAAIELPAGAGADFDAAGTAKVLLRTTRAAALATNDPKSGFPLTTLVNVATDVDGAPLLLLSGLSLHTRNLAADGRASLLLAETGKGDPLAHPRLSLVGRCTRVEDERARRRFLAKHPKSQLYAQLPDFTFWRMELAAVHLNGGFGRAAAIGPADVLTDIAGAEALMEAEPSVIAHMNGDHAEAVRLYATRLAEAPDGRWSVTGCDPDGLDLACGDRTARVGFPERVTQPGQLQLVLKKMAQVARNQP